jgi:hypothetical protein
VKIERERERERERVRRLKEDIVGLDEEYN